MSVPLEFRPVTRQQITYTCQRGHTFAVTFAGDVRSPPAAWDCRCGQPSAGSDPGEPELARRMTQIRERRTGAQLDELLAERLAQVRRAYSES